MPWYAQFQIFKNWRYVTLEINPLILKWYWRTENVVEVQRQWRREYRTEQPTRLTIAHIHDKFETRGTVCDVHKGRSGRIRTSTSPASLAMVLECFDHSPQKSTQQCARETGISRTSVATSCYYNSKVESFHPKTFACIKWRLTLIGECSTVRGFGTWCKRMRHSQEKLFGPMKHNLS